MRNETYYGLMAGVALHVASYVFLDVTTIRASYQPSLTGTALLGGIVGVVMVWGNTLPSAYKPLRRAGAGVIVGTAIMTVLQLALRATGINA